MAILPRTTGRLILSPDGHRQQMFVYGLAHFGKSLIWYASEIVFAYYLTEFAGLSASAMGWVIGIGLLVGAILDPITDLAFTSLLSTAHGAAKLQWVGACFSAATLTSVFLNRWIEQDSQFTFILVTAVAFRCANSIYDQAQNTMVGVATLTPRDRTCVSALRLSLSGLAAVLVAVSSTCLAASEFSHPPYVGPWFLAGAAALSICGASSAGLLYLQRGTHVAAGNREADRTSSWTPLPNACRIPLALGFGTALTIPIFTKAQLYLVHYVHGSVLWGTLIGVGVPLGSLISQPAWTSLSHRYTRQQIILMACPVLLAGAIFFWTVAAAGSATAPIAAFIIGAGSGGIAMAIWASFGDAVGRSDGRPGWSFGLLTGSMKLGLAAGAFVFALLLNTTTAHESVAAHLVTLMVLGPICGSILCLLLAARWHR